MDGPVRISDDLLEAIDDYRTEGETLGEAIERMAGEFGLLPSDLSTVADLRTALRTRYNDRDRVSRTLEVLRLVYTGQEQTGTIGVPHTDIGLEYSKAINTLRQLDLVQKHEYTGKYEFGYRTSDTGTYIGSKLVHEFIKDRKDALQRIIGDYPEPLLRYFLNFGFTETDLKYLSTRQAPLPASYSPLIEDERIQNPYEEFLDRLVDIGVAVRHSDDQFTVLPPEFKRFLEKRNLGTIDDAKRLEIAMAVKTYAAGNVESRERLLELLVTAREFDLREQLTAFHREGLTSEYRDQDTAPFTITDSDRLETRLDQDIADIVATANSA
ncbi:hypothetical protein [Natronosalvus amylolyticus]|uniref:hypothetical protein n=1 Tax=Natronosalvus amylolyticus TaxID=2961994 RepID=UPI0020C9A95E|nr:hypothetical protein [Natronosalvus amylolyticus]